MSYSNLYKAYTAHTYHVTEPHSPKVRADITRRWKRTWPSLCCAVYSSTARSAAKHRCKKGMTISADSHPGFSKDWKRLGFFTKLAPRCSLCFAICETDDITKFCRAPSGSRMVNKHDLYAMAEMTNVNMYTQKYSPHSFPAEPHAQFLFLFLSYTIFYTMKGTVVILFFTLLSSLYLEALHQGEVAKTEDRKSVV